VLNVLGAGDAFASGFLAGWLRDEPLEVCARTANACGGWLCRVMVARPAMPTPAELSYFLDAAASRPGPHAQA
jgi:5-dehydro-2-deoxygluconokinase